MRFLALVLLLSLAGCATPARKSEVSYGSLTRAIVRGKTTQKEVVDLLGSPNLVTRTSRGGEVWTYNRRSYNTETGTFGGGAVMFGGNRSFSSAAPPSFDLVLTFNPQAVVQEYSILSSQF